MSVSAFARFRPATAVFSLALTFTVPAYAQEPSSDTNLVGVLGSRSRVEISGNQAFSPDQILNGLGLRMEYHLAAHPLAPRSAYPTSLENLIRRGYLRAGFPEARVTARLDEVRQTVDVSISEGPRYQCGQVRLLGTNAATSEALQQRLVAKLNELPPSNAPQTTNWFRSMWQPGLFAPFDSAAIADFRVLVNQTLAELNYYNPQLTIRVVPQAGKGVADLEIEMLDEGLKGKLEEIEIHYPAGRGKNTDDDITGFLEVRRGMEIRPPLIAEITNKLWSSARFLQHDATLTPMAGPEKFKLDLTLEEIEGAPSLSAPLSTNQLVLLKFRQWTADLGKRREDLAFSVSLATPNAVPIELEAVLSPSGMLLAAYQSAKEPPRRFLGAVILGERVVEFYSGKRKHKLRHEGTNVAFSGVVRLTPNLDPASHSRFDFQMGGGFKTHSEEGSSLQFDLAPAAFLYLSLEPQVTSRMTNGTLEFVADPDGIHPLSYLKIDAATGRLIDHSAGGITNGAGILVHAHAEPGAFDKIHGRILVETAGYKEDYSPDYPLSSWLGFLLTEVFETDLMDSPFARELLAMAGEQTNATSPRALFAQAQSVLLGLKRSLHRTDLAECFMPIEKSLHSWVENARSAPLTQENAMLVPADGQVTGGAPTTLLGNFAPLVIQYADYAWEPHTWCWTLTRELGFHMAQQPRYTARVLERLIQSPDLGPIGCWATAALLARVDAPLAEKFARRALDQLAPDKFNQDMAVLLQPRSAAGQVLSELLRLGCQVEETDLAAFSSALGIAQTNSVLEAVRVLRNATNQPPAELLKPMVKQHWDTLFKPALESRLTAFAQGISTPRNPDDALARAQFIYQSAKSAEEAGAAVPFLRYAAEQGNPQGMMLLGQVYENGQLAPQDLPKALDWYTRAEALGYPHAGCRVADFYFTGKGLPVDRDKAAEYYRREADRGCGRSQFQMGMIAEAEKHPEQALDWYRRAGTNGFVAAQSALGERLSDGVSYPVDYLEAYLWSRAAAKQGDRMAGASARRLREKLKPDEVERAETELEKLAARWKPDKPNGSP